MNQIKVLPEALANKIAAGEVVERPSSVVKELVENAIDAGATRIIIIIKNAGKSLIQVIDNGKGMSENDAMLAFERHATSKISEFSDFEHLKSMGFRGEALPSIAGVSQVELVTRLADTDLATQVKIDGSKIRHMGKTSSEIGTSISVKNLFFNVPARKNFLKTNATEFSHILNILKRIFLAHPEVHFECFQENDQIYHLPKGDITERIRGVLGEHYFNSMIPVEETIGEVRLTGYALNPSFLRQSKGQQFVFINKRMVSSKYLSHAIHKAYGDFLNKGEYPGYCLYLEMSPKLFDVNVHPTKMEVKFTNDKMMYNFFTSAIQHALHKNIQEPATDKHQELGYEPIYNKHIEPVSIQVPEEKSSVVQTLPKKKKKTAFIPNQASLELSFTPKDQVLDQRLTQPKESSQTESSDHVFWQLHKQYIFSQVKSGCVIIDQQLAHERILFEKVYTALQDNIPSPSQQLLFPQTIELSTSDYETYSDIEEELNTIGYTVKQFSGKTIVLESIPGEVKIHNEAQSLLDILSHYTELKANKKSKNENIAFSFAMKNSIQSGETLTQQEMHALMDQLFATSNPHESPIGKTIISQFNLDELSRRFK